MHEATVTIRKLWPPYKVGDKRTSLEDTDGNKYRLEIMTGAGYHDGDTVDIGFTNEVTAPEFGGKEYKLIKKMKLSGASGSPLLPVAKPAQPSDIGPHIGMWEKRASELLVEFGMSAAAIHDHIVECRQIAQKGVRADINNKKPQSDFDDSLEDTF